MLGKIGGQNGGQVKRQVSLLARARRLFHPDSLQRFRASAPRRARQSNNPKGNTIRPMVYFFEIMAYPVRPRARLIPHIIY